MTSLILQEQAKRSMRPVPSVRAGFTVRVHERIQEGAKERVQVFEGLVINTHRGHVPTDASITVRKIVSGVGVEKIFPLHSPVVEKIEVKKVSKVRRAKLFFLRGRTGKAARLSERFTTEGEFQNVAAPVLEDLTVSAEADPEPAAAEMAEQTEQAHEKPAEEEGEQSADDAKKEQA